MRIYDRIIEYTHGRYGNKTEETSSESEESTDSPSIMKEKMPHCKYVTELCQHILFFSSFQLSFALMFSLYCQFYYLAIFNSGLLLSSIIHWNKPTLGLRRKIDITMAFINCIIHAIYAFSINSMCFFVWLLATIFMIVLYLTGKRFSYNSYSTLYHLLVHATGTMSALSIYYISKNKLIDHS
ncbi:conserved Plasmodium membrane protein, unknown function [Plasmodium knowlesi strain H]|uniref:Uncharacterized protein n=3 Tax=Plasmodium knowlesi TaxID=5850 RepID=A0A5K1VDH9_PLAKH|nr:uncharacterized protein PKNH_0109800 [Plasmodium knowlesi strain H]OTN68680.1 Uncharacterized protein PKNOH_S01018100 [Plasmodium knowlesi]CAA9986178.1 conserved protein, unknown function [Plasmodium knowlesi strain H]SBO25376.1 conserved Plasmodium membrane protein, unknown function [Plasmodium knowlesi strain H]SBO27672.1 conserved Plasmodium membrane protein, unknown function [Plasmodium knowlesi strain H]VVS75652.1 conserved protein, unknown function [Plasmodium knowlesi strain H]|eukprot:XP_002257589.1 [Plasmodium knowlesi strain H]